MSDSQLIHELIDQILLVRSPEFGARLKQRLNEVLTKRGEDRFNERALGFRKFSDFLESQPLRWTIERSQTGGDISVSLRSAPAAKLGPVSTITAPTNAATFRNDVWQAFVNPDPKRKRFLSRNDLTVKHFVVGDLDSPALHLINASPQKFAEINPVDGTSQTTWMKEFLGSLPLQLRDRAPIEAMIGVEYTSSINVAFTRALGSHGDAWRRYRTDRIAALIDQWAEKAGLSPASLRKPADLAQTGDPTSQPPKTPDVRTKIHKLMELVSEDDLERLILPALLTTISLRANK
jgi:hypothetical protein